MPQTDVVLYREGEEDVPALDWLGALPKKARAKCIAALQRLALLGHELRRPEADYLRDGIYELRVGLQGMNYRMLYFFHGRTMVVVSHGLAKERVIPPKEIELAIRRKKRFGEDPTSHTFQPPGAPKWPQ